MLNLCHLTNFKRLDNILYICSYHSWVSLGRTNVHSNNTSDEIISSKSVNYETNSYFIYHQYSLYAVIYKL